MFANKNCLAPPQKTPYAISSWYNAMSKAAKNKLQIIQNKIIRFILDLGPRTHITNKHMLDLNLLKIPRRVQQLRLNITHKIYHNQAPTYLQANFHKNRVSTHRTRGSQGNFVVPNVKGAEGSTFYFNAIKDWNNLPIDIKNCENLGSFKTRVKNTSSRKRQRKQIGNSYSFKSNVTRIQL